MFAQRRKTLWNNLRAAKAKWKLDEPQLRSALGAAQIDAQRRAETLTLEETARLSNHLKEFACNAENS
jgi:16S rRNA (adenine1518-N6/adenine1519-N6)-dimethyltransferase